MFFDGQRCAVETTPCTFVCDMCLPTAQTSTEIRTRSKTNLDEIRRSFFELSEVVGGWFFVCQTHQNHFHGLRIDQSMFGRVPGFALSRMFGAVSCSCGFHTPGNCSGFFIQN